MNIHMLGVFDSIGDAMWSAIAKAIWIVFIQGPLNLISVVNGVFEYLTTGILFDVIFDGNRTFGIDNIPSSFFAFCYLSIFLMVMIFAIQYLSYTFNEDISMKERIVKAVKSSALSIVFVILMPIGFYCLVLLIEFLQNVFQLAFGLTDTNLADLIYKIGDPDWDGVTSLEVPAFYAPPENITDYNLVVEILACWFLLYTLVMLCMAMVQKSIELFLMFLIGPLIAAWMVNDYGARLKQWKDMTMAKALTSIGNILSFVIMTTFMSFFITKINGKFDVVSRMFIFLIVILGVSTFSLVAPQIISSFTGGEAVNHSEGRNAISSAIHAKGILGTGVKALGWATGMGGAMALLGKAKSIGSAGSIAGSVAGGVASAMSGGGGGNPNVEIGKQNRMNAKGLPGLLGKTVSKASAMVGGATNIFSKRGWSNMGQNVKNVAKGAAAMAGVGLASNFVAKRKGSITQHANTLSGKQETIKNRFGSKISKLKSKKENTTSSRKIASLNKKTEQILNKQNKFENYIDKNATNKKE